MWEHTLSCLKVRTYTFEEIVPSGHMTFIQRRLNVDATLCWVISWRNYDRFKGLLLKERICSWWEHFFFNSYNPLTAIENTFEFFFVLEETHLDPWFWFTKQLFVSSTLRLGFFVVYMADSKMTSRFITGIVHFPKGCYGFCLYIILFYMLNYADFVTVVNNYVTLLRKS